MKPLLREHPQPIAWLVRLDGVDGARRGKGWRYARVLCVRKIIFNAAN